MINFVAIAKFFHIIYDAIFMFLFGVSQTAKEFFGLISHYFSTVEINGCGILHLQCLL